jgi:hypothetical protein
VIIGEPSSSRHCLLSSFLRPNPQRLCSRRFTDVEPEGLDAREVVTAGVHSLPCVLSVEIVVAAEREGKDSSF